MLLKAAMPFNFRSPEYLGRDIIHRTRKNRVSPVSRASPADVNSPQYSEDIYTRTTPLNFFVLEFKIHVCSV